MTDQMEGLLTIRDVAKLLGVSVRTVESMRLPRVRLPGAGKKAIVRFDPVEIRAFIESRKTSRVARLVKAS